MKKRGRCCWSWTSTEVDGPETGGVTPAPKARSISHIGACEKWERERKKLPLPVFFYGRHLAPPDRRARSGGAAAGMRNPGGSGYSSSTETIPST